MASFIHQAINACIEVETEHLLRKIEESYHSETKEEDEWDEVIIKNALKAGLKHKDIDTMISCNKSYIKLITKLHDILRAGVFKEE